MRLCNDKLTYHKLSTTHPFHPIFSTAVNFINILHALFSYESLFKAKLKAEKRLLYKKCVRKMLMKLTPGENVLYIENVVYTKCVKVLD